MQEYRNERIFERFRHRLLGGFGRLFIIDRVLGEAFMTLIQIFLLMIVGHAIADYPLQGDFLSRAKNRTNPIPGVPWYQALIAHAVIQGGFVGIITESVALGLAEAIAHCLIDDLKCRGKISFNADQICHIACKLVWLGVFHDMRLP